MKITPWFTHLQAILGVCDFLLSDECIQSYIKKCPGSSKLYSVEILKSNKVRPSIIKMNKYLLKRIDVFV